MCFCEDRNTQALNFVYTRGPSLYTRVLFRTAFICHQTCIYFGYKTVGFLRNKSFKDLSKSFKVLSVCFVSLKSLYDKKLEEELPRLIAPKYPLNLVEFNLQNFEIRTICCCWFAFYLGSCMTPGMHFVTIL